MSTRKGRGLSRETSTGGALRKRFRSAQGHMRAVDGMIERDAPAADIILQLLAVRGALAAINWELWRVYLLDARCGLWSEYDEARARAWCGIKCFFSAKNADNPLARHFKSD